MKAPAGPNQKESFSQMPDQALEQMMKQYGTAVIRSAYFYTGDRHLAEDISQEAFIRAYRNWNDFRGDSSVKTWLMRITVNLCRDKLGVKMSTEQPTDPGQLDLNRTFGVEDEVLRKLEKTEVLQHVLKLGMSYQEVIYLYYYMDMSTPEIAEAISVPEGTVRARLHRAREQLGQLLNEEE